MTSNVNCRMKCGRRFLAPRWKPVRVLAVMVVCLLSLLGPAAAEDGKKKGPPKPLTTEEAVEAVLQAAEAKDDEALKALAEKVFDGDVERVTNAVMGLSKFQHGDGVYGRESTMSAASKMLGHRWAQLPSHLITAVARAAPW